MRRFLLAISLILLLSPAMPAQDPTATKYSAEDCLGTHLPYPAPEALQAVPDSLTPVFVNHVGRHGARFPSSMRNTAGLLKVLHKADSACTLTPLGREFYTLAQYVAEKCHNRWGALDSLGMAEQRGIATRMFRAYPGLFKDSKVKAISSYSPRCMMSMFEFTHQLDRLNNNVEITTSTGRSNSPLLRPFDLNKDYIEFREAKAWEEPYNMLFETTAPTAPARKLLGEALTSSKEAREFSFELYDFLSCLPMISMAPQMYKYLTPEEMNACWALSNLHSYLRYSANTVSTVPADIATDLLLELINTTDNAALGQTPAKVMLRFGHAETLMPLLSLMRLHGCYYMTNYFDTVALHWRDFDIVPMAANLQMVLLKSEKGNYYLRVDLNEHPIPLLPNSEEIYIPWGKAREYLNRCLPLHLQI